MVEFKRFRSGFTLIELMVTIAIITILLSIVAIASTKLQQQSRDSEREGDVSAIMSALEKYYDKNGEYPSSGMLNPTLSSGALPNFNATKTILPPLTDNDLTGPGGYNFFASCLTSCDNSETNWGTYRPTQYFYMSREEGSGSGTYRYSNVPSSYANNQGWGCMITTYYNDPGYIIAWRREQDKLWVFKRSAHGKIDIAASPQGGPVAPQTCTFS